jgi:hypothetical protein
MDGALSYRRWTQSTIVSTSERIKAGHDRDVNVEVLAGDADAAGKPPEP